VAERMRTTLSHASEYLRALQARGLISARRESRWVCYRAAPDPLVAGSQPLLKALGKAILHDRQCEESLIQVLTAFTHPRRLMILRLLQERGPLYAEDVGAITRMSPPALSRHMAKLRVRNLVVYTDDKWNLTRPRDPLARALLSILCESP